MRQDVEESAKAERTCKAGMSVVSEVVVLSRNGMSQVQSLSRNGTRDPRERAHTKALRKARHVCSADCLERVMEIAEQELRYRVLVQDGWYEGQDERLHTIARSCPVILCSF